VLVFAVHYAFCACVGHGWASLYFILQADLKVDTTTALRAGMSWATFRSG
jgi:hypothetical protein